MNIKNNPLVDVLPSLLCVSEILTEFERNQILDYYREYGRDAVLEFAREEKAVPFISLLLSEIDCDRGFWENVHLNYTFRNEILITTLDYLFGEFERAGGKTLCVVENFGSVLSSDISIGCFGSSDVDLTADISEKSLLVSVMEKRGFTIQQRGHHASDSKELTTFFNPEVTEDGYWLNVMWMPVSRPSFLIQKAYAKRLQKERLDAINYKSTKIRLLHPDAMLYFCALHIACGHFYTREPGMRLYCDIDRLVRSKSIDWLKLKSWAESDRAGCRIDLVLDICNTLLKTNIPESAFSDRVSSERYTRLKNFVFDSENRTFIKAVKKRDLLYVELMSDNTMLLKSFFMHLRTLV